MRWRKELWGVQFTDGRKGDKPMLLGFAWHDMNRERLYYLGEPTRALLFTSRAAARSWCRCQHNKNRGRSDCCAKWRFRPVRVVESIRPLDRTTKP